MNSLTSGELWVRQGNQWNMCTPHIRIKSGMGRLSIAEIFICWSRRLLLLGFLAKQKQLAAKISSLGRFRSLWSEQCFWAGTKPRSSFKLKSKWQRGNFLCHTPPQCKITLVWQLYCLSCYLKLFHQILTTEHLNNWLWLWRQQLCLTTFRKHYRVQWINKSMLDLELH